MSDSGITPVETYLIESAVSFVRDYFECKKIHIDAPIDRKIGWRPSMHLTPSGHKIVAIEASEDPYPQILQLNHANLVNAGLPICAYTLCPEDSFLDRSNQKAIKMLKGHGFGLMTVDDSGQVEIKIQCIPLAQHIPEIELETAIGGLPPTVRVSIREAYEIYRHHAPQGVTKLSELIEGIIYSAAKSMKSKGWIDPPKLTLSLASLIDHLSSLQQCAQLKASLGGARAYVAETRNNSHHSPKSKKDAHKKYMDCQHSFRDGLRRISALHESLKKVRIRMRL